MTNAAVENQESKVFNLQWKWIIIGLFFGLVLTIISIDLTASSYPGTIIPSFIVSVGFLIMGILVGYFSPGVTIKEASISGILMIVLLIILASILGQLNVIPLYYIIIAFIVGFLFSLLGGWIGEVLQGDKSKSKIAGLEWQWIIVGVVLGFIVSNFLFLVLSPKFTERIIIYSLGIGFILTGIVVGLKSPGVTIIEAAIAGAITAILDYLFLIYLSTQNIPIYAFSELKMSFTPILLVFIIGLILALLGGWIGEMIQQRYEKGK
jgi:uncharacterized membrane protein YsdA (DUF1294 family)